MLLIANTELSSAGPLEPPPGPVAPTPGPESRIPISPETTPGDSESLFRITQPGSYIFQQSLVGVAGKHGLSIETTDVTVDLNGFTFRGAVGSHDAIRSPLLGPRVNLRIQNGTLTDWGEDGIDIRTNTVTISNIRVQNCGGAGIQVNGSATLLSTVSSANDACGITVGQGSRIADCISEDNADFGIVVGSGSTISGSIASGNGDWGILLQGGSITNSTASQNALEGIVVMRGSVTNCVANSNEQAGFQVSDTIISGCTANNNGWDGILAEGSCTIRSNFCRNNGSRVMPFNFAGIRVQGTVCFVEKNNCIGNDIGIKIGFGLSTIAGNICAVNGVNYQLDSKNVIGEIVSGFSDGGSIGQGTGSWINISIE